MDQKHIILNDEMSMEDKFDHESHGLRGHVQIFRRNKLTNETSLWYEGSNVVTLTGYQWLLTKALNLYLDSSHGKSYERIDRDTTLVTPDLNESDTFGIGVDPSGYTPMTDNIGVNHFIQGFMVGNGGAGEDTITSKNTNYSFKMLRNPIPFQQTQAQTGLPSELAGKYCGVLRTGTSTKSYYIKKFDETPHIYHSWWSDGQKWDDVDRVTREDLGPNATNGVGKTNRIETYAECRLTIDEGDFVSYFNNSSISQSTAMINELGLVAFDSTSGTRSTIINVYNQKIIDLLMMVFDRSKDSLSGTDRDAYVTSVQELADVVHSALSSDLANVNQSNLRTFMGTVDKIRKATTFTAIRTELSDTKSNIGVEALYNQNNTLQYTTDNFLTYLKEVTFSNEDEAQRIKLITYYTFNSIPVETNWELLINYRLYAN